MIPYLLAAKRSYDAIPPQRKRTMWLIVISILVILLMKNKIAAIWKTLFHNDVAKMDYNASNLSFSETEYFSMCSTLEAAMNGTGTQDESIMMVMRRLNTQDDWTFLQKSFGTRKKDGGTFFSDITGDLKAWLSDELDGDEMEEITQILQSKGIRF